MSHPYTLRSRLNAQVSPVRSASTASPTIPKAGSAAHRKRQTEYDLQLRRVIGTTTNNPSGLACCANSYAYCAGAVAVFAELKQDGTPKHKYYRCRPLASSINPPTSHYESPNTTPSRRRTSVFTPRKAAAEEEAGTWTARERIKTISCVALSCDGKWLAVGESGYNPRVLLFSTAGDASTDIPVSIVTDHSYGLRCVGFSPDLKYLATLGDYKDGFLFIWAFNSKTGSLTLHSANKCTANICDMTWCGNNLITVGTRLIRAWQVQEAVAKSPVRKSRFRPSEIPASPGPAPLAGRNVLLGSMVDCTFTCVVPVNDQHLVVGTETGHLCLVDLTQNVLELKTLMRSHNAIHSLAFMPSTNQLLIGTSRGVQREDWTGLRVSSADYSPRKTHRSSIRRSLGLLHETEKTLTAIGVLADHVVTLDNDGNLQIENIENESQTLAAAHKSVIQGVQALPTSAQCGQFFTYSKNGEVKFWASDGTLLKTKSLELDSAEDAENELTLMRYSEQNACFVAGDRFGVLRLIKNSDWTNGGTVRAHSADVCSIDVLESLVATCSRDRMIQLLRIGDNGFELLQTMDDHAGAVTQVLFANNKLLSCSTDRSLIIRDRVARDGGCAYLTTKVLTMKGSPLAFTMLRESTLAVSTMDRKITKVDIDAGTLLDSYKVADMDSDETVFLTSVITTNNMLVGYSSMDKSIRVYSEDNLTPFARESGHTEGVSDIALLSSGRIVTTGLDGTIMIWEVCKAALRLELSPTKEWADDLEASKRSPASLPPMRKVLTKMEIAALTNAPLSPGSPRSLSPMRLKRRTSRLALSTSMEDVEESPNDRQRSPSPPRLKSRRSRAELSTDPHGRSPSPTTMPKTRQQANNGRLRRPPSVPDLRARRQSIGQTSDFGSMAMATDQCARMLRIYKKKLTGSKDDVTLDELEVEVGALLRVIRERKDRTSHKPSDRDMEQLAVLLNGASMNEQPLTPT